MSTESRVAAIERTLASIRGDGRTVAVSKLGGITICGIGQQRPSTASASSSYSGPFAVVKKDDTTATILGYHSDEGRDWRNYVYAGLTATEVAEQDKGSLGAASGYLYIDVTYSGGYSVAVGFATSVPAQTSTHYYHPLAWIECEESKISSITQLHYGQVYIAGRVV